MLTTQASLLHAVLEGVLQRDRTNRIEMEIEIFYKELTHVIMEAE